MVRVVEFDCPIQQADADIYCQDDQCVSGLVVECPWCGGRHVVGVDIDANVMDEDGGFLYSIDRQTGT